MIKDTTFKLRINSEVKKKLEAEAKKQGISLAEFMIKSSLEAISKESNN